MKKRVMLQWVVPTLIGILTLGGLIWIVGSTWAQGLGGDAEGQGDISIAATVAGKIKYQGRLTDSAGMPLNGPYQMQFQLYDDATSGTLLWESGPMDVQVDEGLFDVELGVDPKFFDGRGLWLRIYVEGEWLAPRQELVPVPYALSLRPGATIRTTTGSAVTVESIGGFGLYGYSQDNYAVYGRDAGTTQAQGYGGYFTSDNGVGVFGGSGGERVAQNLYAPGVYGSSVNGVGVYGVTSSSHTDSAGVRGEGTDTNGVYGRSETQYGGYFYSENGGGLYATSRFDDYAGMFVNRTGSAYPGLYVLGYTVTTGSKTGYVVDICLNDGPEALETGDVVVVTGFDEPVAGDIPVPRVRKATQAESTGVVGVVDQPFTLSAERIRGVGQLPHAAAASAQLGEGTAIGPGDYLSVVTLGSFKAIKVDASYGAIEPGDLLVSSPNPGFAMRAEAPGVGTVIGKALDGLEEGAGVIPVLVTLD
jgi:hypothetical protein